MQHRSIRNHSALAATFVLAMYGCGGGRSTLDDSDGFGGDGGGGEGGFGIGGEGNIGVGAEGGAGLSGGVGNQGPGGSGPGGSGPGGGGPGGGGAGGSGGGTPIDCLLCAQQNCPDLQQCVTDVSCAQGLFCAIDTCLGGGGPDPQCFFQCFDDPSDLLLVGQGLACAAQECTDECGSLLGGLPF